MPEVREKIKQTTWQKYGVEHLWKDLEVHAKNMIKSRQTCLDRYGVEYCSQSDIVKEKRNKTWQEKYGFTSPMKNNKVIEKSYETRKRNCTLNTSKPEELLYEILKFKYPNVIRQHKDNVRYPFACDFYIPEKDLFIELNKHWTHGFEPFDSVKKEHIQKLNEWKEKQEEHPSYKSAIKVWTIKDVEKRQTAKKNCLNYIEVFSKDFIELKEIL